MDKMNSGRSESESDLVEVKEYSDIKRIMPAELENYYFFVFEESCYRWAYCTRFFWLFQLPLYLVPNKSEVQFRENIDLYRSSEAATGGVL